METGIGRTGIRLLAVLTFAIGALGVAVTVNGMPEGAGAFVGLGLGIVCLALLVLTALAFPGVGRVKRVKKPKQKRAKKSKKAKAPDQFERELDIDLEAIDVVGQAPTGPVEFSDVTRMPPPQPAPVAVEAAPQADPRAWPERANATHPTAPVHSQHSKRNDLAAKYTQRTPLVRGILQGQPQTAVFDEIPEVTADVPPPGMHQSMMPQGTVRGRCGGCQTQLLAPTARPIRLRCPRCSRTTLLRD